LTSQEKRFSDAGPIVVVFVQCCNIMSEINVLQDIMMDPVIAADGQTYERAQIVQWLRRKQTSPLTNLSLSDRGLIPNDSLRAAIKEWKEYRREGVLNKVDIGG
jgi:hypothetical protein